MREIWVGLRFFFAQRCESMLPTSERRKKPQQSKHYENESSMGVAMNIIERRFREIHSPHYPFGPFYTAVTLLRRWNT